MRSRRRILAPITMIVLLSTVAAAQGVKTKRSAVVLFGSTVNCSQPATIHYKKVQRATPEWKTIRAQNVRRGSARYELLISGMSDRIKAAVAAAARSHGRDCVLRSGDIRNANGLRVVDLTDKVLAALGP